MLTRYLPETTPDDFIAVQRLLGALLPPHRLRALLTVAGSPSAALALSIEQLTTDPAIALTQKQTERLIEAAVAPMPAGFLGQAAALGAWVVGQDDPVYPRHLTPFNDAPPLMFVRGDLKVEDGNAIAIVGSRRSTAYGMEQADRFARTFAEHGLTLVSGGAIGIDTAAHRGALSGGGRTIAILGCGVDISYPSENRALFAEIAARGALFSEFALGSRPEPWRFPTRNRIIAGIARATLLIETPVGSGAMITARDAAQYGRDVWAVPGAIGGGNRSQGCHRLIQDGAGLADAPEDILRALGIEVVGDAEAEVGLPRPPARAQSTRRTPTKRPSTDPDDAPVLPLQETSEPPAEIPEMLRVALSPNEASLLEGFSQIARHVDEASLAAGLSASEAAVALTLLEMKGLLQRQPGNLYVRL